MSTHAKHLLDSANRARLAGDDQHANILMELYYRELKREAGK